MTLSFESISPDTAHRYFKHWVAVSEKPKRKYTKKELPDILVKPPSKKVMNAGHKLVTKHIITEKAELSPKVKRLIESQYKYKISDLKQRHDEKVHSLKKRIAELEKEVATVHSQLEAYKRREHPSYMTKDDVNHHIRVLEHKLAHLDKKSQTYHDLAEKLSDVKKRLLA